MNNTHVLFPADPLRPRQPDDLFAEQFNALSSDGFSCSLRPDDALNGDHRLKGIPEESSVLYRGWMLDAGGYERLARAIREAGAVPFTSPNEYLAAHHLPRWYPLLRDLTPETHVFPNDADLEAGLRGLGWDHFFVKDYVKSLKTSVGSVLRDPSQIREVVAEMERFRGGIEGGIRVRRVEAFLPDTEVRYFVLRGKPFAPDGSGRVPEAVRLCAERVPSPLFSVDVAVREDGVERIVEIGDGQVSDLVGWTVPAFVEMLTTVFSGSEA